MEVDPPWTCAVCTFCHGGAESSYLACSMCSTPRSIAPGGSSACSTDVPSPGGLEQKRSSSPCGLGQKRSSCLEPPRSGAHVKRSKRSNDADDGGDNGGGGGGNGREVEEGEGGRGKARAHPQSFLRRLPANPCTVDGRAIADSELSEYCPAVIKRRVLPEALAAALLSELESHATSRRLWGPRKTWTVFGGPRIVAVAPFRTPPKSYINPPSPLTTQTKRMQSLARWPTTV